MRATPGNSCSAQTSMQQTMQLQFQETRNRERLKNLLQYKGYNAPNQHFNNFHTSACTHIPLTYKRNLNIKLQQWKQGEGAEKAKNTKCKVQEKIAFQKLRAA